MASIEPDVRSSARAAASAPLSLRLREALQSPAAAEFAIVALASLTFVALLALRTDLMTRDHPLFAEPGWDHHAYIAMATGNPFDFHLAPFGWRIGVPLLAKLSPLPLQASFLFIAFVGITGAAVSMYYLGRRIGGSRAYGAFAALLFLSLGWASKFGLLDFWLPDAVAFFAVALAMLCIVDRRPRAFAAVLLLGVFVKEAVIFVAPLWYTLHATRLVDRRLPMQTVLLALPAVALLLALRLLIPAQNSDLDYAATLSPAMQQFRDFIPTYSYMDLLRDIGWHHRLHDYSTETLLLYSTGTWGAGVLALAAIGAVRRPVLALRLLPFLLLVYAQLLFALNIERLLVLGFPAMVWLALEGVRALVTNRPPVSAWFFAASALALALLNLKNPAAVPLRFELQALVFFAGFAIAVGWPAVVRRDVTTAPAEPGV